MATPQGKRVSHLIEQREGLRKSPKVRSGEMRCPVCDLTLRPETLGQHYKQELEKLRTTSTSLTHTKKKRKLSAGGGGGGGGGGRIVQEAHQVLESVKRRRISYNQIEREGATGSGPSIPTCPVCNMPLPAEEGMAQAHVNECLGTSSREGEGRGRSSEEEEEESYEEYTWCNVTRVRATSMLTAEARANMFDGTLISKVDTSLDGEVDVEEDETEIYGPVQFSEADVKERNREEGEEVRSKTNLQCLICMDTYHVPLVSIKCWHVFCEGCWLEALRNKKLCPKCKNITSSNDLRIIYL